MQNTAASLYRYPERIISGGQTGIDQLGLEVAHSLGIPTGGLAPKGDLTERGPDERLRDVYGLTEHSSASYPPRTKSNVKQSDGTVLFGEMTGGTKLTLDTCETEHRPYIVNPTADELLAWLTANKIKVLNVAGNRESSLTMSQLNAYRKVLIDALGASKTLRVLFAEPPGQWGLRGDPYLWQDLAKLGETLLLPASESDLRTLLVVLIKNLTGVDLENLEASGHSIDDWVGVPRYRYGGMSGGAISPAFWIDTAIPLLLKRFNKISPAETA